MIDPHVHCRDGAQRQKETIAHALKVAEESGLSAVFDMPNTSPPITTRDLVLERLKIAQDAKSPVVYGLYIGLTSDPHQIEEAIMVWRELFPKVVGLKLYAGHSVGDLAVVDEDDQRQVYEVLAKEGFIGVLAVHCEKEALIKPELWDPLHPETHSESRPAISEIESIKDQIRFAKKAGFKGTLHICHITTPEGVDLVDSAKGDLKITCGVTPHHCVLNLGVQSRSEEPILFKVNPPIRDEQTTERMLRYLMQGRIDMIETDHAPHTYDDKTENFMSGFPGLPFYPHFVKFLRKEGMNREEVLNLTHHNINRIFGTDLKERIHKPNLSLETEYEFDVYKKVKEEWKLRKYK